MEPIDKPSSRPEQSSDFGKAKVAGIVNQAMHTAAINNELKRRILTLMNMADIPDKKLSREPRLLKTIFCPADRGCGPIYPPHRIASFRKILRGHRAIPAPQLKDRRAGLGK
jgi:hypothetical protein